MTGICRPTAIAFTLAAATLYPVSTALAQDAKRVAMFSGVYTAQLRDVEPEATAKPKVASMARSVHVDLTRFEFEG